MGENKKKVRKREKTEKRVFFSNKYQSIDSERKSLSAIE